MKKKTRKTLKKVFRLSLLLLAIVLFLLVGRGTAYDRADKQVVRKLAVALKKLDPTICLSLSGRVQKAPRPDDAKGVPYSKFPQYDCLYEYAKHTGNIEACNLMKNNDLHSRSLNSIDSCRSVVAEVNSDPAICDTLKGPAAWTKSVTCRAVAKLNRDECFKVTKTNSDLKARAMESCIYTMISHTTEPEECRFDYEDDSIDWTFLENKCLFTIATCGRVDNERIKGVCDLITYDGYYWNEYIKEICYQGDAENCYEPPERLKLPE